MYSPDEQGKYMPLDGTPRFSMQGLSDALADVGEGKNKPPVEEYAMMLEVTMVDHPGWESNSLVQLVEGTPQQTGRSTAVEETAKARLATHAGTVQLHG